MVYVQKPTAIYGWMGCKHSLSALPVLTYFYVRSAPVLERRYFRRILLQMTIGFGELI